MEAPFDISIQDDGSVHSAVEEKVWCLRELGQAIWYHHNNSAQALVHLQEAVDLSQAYQWKFNFVERGELLRDKWEMMVCSGDFETARNEAIEQTQKVFPSTAKVIAYFSMHSAS